MGSLDSLIERWWMQWVDVAPGIPYWDPYVASFTLFVAVIVVFNILRVLFALRGRGRTKGFQYARMSAERDKRLREKRERLHQG